MTNEPSPRPWSLFVHDEQEGGDGEVSICAEGEWIATMNLRRSTAKTDAALIVDAVNERAKFEEARMEFPDFRPVVIAAGQRDAAIAERDRLRDIVRRLTEYADAVTGYRPRTVEVLSSEHPAWTFDGAALLREARAAIGEEEK